MFKPFIMTCLKSNKIKHVFINKKKANIDFILLFHTEKMKVYTKNNAIFSFIKT